MGEQFNFNSIYSSTSTNSWCGSKWEDTSINLDSSGVSRYSPYFYPLKLNNSALLDNYVERTDRDIFSTEGWKILKVSIGKVSSDYGYGFVTNPDAWLEKFEIMLFGRGTIRMILVNEDCPDYYLAEPEDIIKFADQALGGTTVTATSEIDDQLKELLSNLSSIYDKDTVQGLTNTTTIVC